MRLFHLQRDEDPTGVSGTGVVADGVEFDDSTVAIRWRGDTPSTVVWDNIADAEYVHGHVGRTRFVFLGYDGQPLGDAPEPPSRTLRGFANYATLTDTYGREVTVRQSSGADLDAVWIFVGTEDRNKYGAHLDADGARQVRDALNHWLLSIGDPAARRMGGDSQ